MGLRMVLERWQTCLLNDFSTKAIVGFHNEFKIIALDHVLQLGCGSGHSVEAYKQRYASIMIHGIVRQ